VKLVNPTKATIALVGMVCLTILMALNAIPSEAGVGLLGSIVGYAIGNGVQARKGEAVTPIFGPKD